MEFIKAIMKCNYITKKHAFYWYEKKNELEIENLEQKNARAHTNFNESFREKKKQLEERKLYKCVCVCDTSSNRIFRA